MDVFTLQSGSASISIVDSKGRPASVDGVPVWASSDETVLSVAAAADGMSATITTVGIGTARLSVTADADLGEGVSTLVGVSEDLNVTQNPNSVASSVAIAIGPLTDNP